MNENQAWVVEYRRHGGGRIVSTGVRTKRDAIELIARFLEKGHSIENISKLSLRSILAGEVLSMMNNARLINRKKNQVSAPT